jgi:hypothetical protein
MNQNPSNFHKMGTEFKTGVVVYKVASDCTCGRKGIVMAVNASQGKSLVYWYRQGYRRWVSWNSLKLK